MYSIQFKLSQTLFSYILSNRMTFSLKNESKLQIPSTPKNGDLMDKGT